MKTSQIVYLIVSATISFITAYIGGLIIIQTKENLLIGVLSILMGFILLFFSFYTLQIKTNQDEINDIKEEFRKIKENEKSKEKLLNTIKDIVLLNNTKKMDKRGKITSSDLLELLKIAIILIVGYIIIKALLTAA